MAERVDDHTLQRTFESSLATLALVAAVAVFLTVASLVILDPAWLTLGPVALGPVPALVVVGGVLFGPVAVLATVGGYAGYHLLTGTFAIWETLGLLMFGLLTWLLWRTLTDARTDKAALDSVGGFVRLFVAVAIGSLWGACVVGWGYELTGGFSFFPTAPLFAAEAAISAVAFGLVVPIAVARFVSDGLRSRIRATHPSVPSTSGGRGTGWLVALPVGWIVVGSVASVGFQVIELVPPFHFRVRNLEALLVFKDAWPFGPSGMAIQLALGVSCLTLLALGLWRAQRAPVT